MTKLLQLIIDFKLFNWNLTYEVVIDTTYATLSKTWLKIDTRKDLVTSRLT